MSNRRKAYEKARNEARNSRTKLDKRKARMAMLTGLAGMISGAFSMRSKSVTAGVNKYAKPHQGAQECARRRKQLCLGEFG